MQVPIAKMVTVDPFTPLVEQTASVCEANDTAKPDDAVAEIRIGAAPIDWLAKPPKEMVCVPWLMVKLCGTGAAALKLALPA